MGFYRIRNLVLLQLGNRFKLAKKGIVAVSLTVVLSFVGLLAMTGVFIGLLLVFKSFFYIPLTRNFLFFLVVLIQFLNIIALMSSMITSLYGSKDNPILLSMPAEGSEVFYSKLIVAYINEFIKSLYITLPLMLGFGILCGLNIWFFVASAILTFILPLIALLLSSLISIPIMFVTRAFKKITALYVITVFVLFVGVLFGIYSLLQSLPDPLRLKAMYNAVLIAIDKSAGLIANNSLFYVWAADFAFGQKTLVSILYLLAVIVVLLILNLVLSKPLFFSLACQSGERARIKVHKRRSLKARRTYRAFLQKEFTLSFRKFGQLISEYTLIALLPFFLYLVNGIVGALILNGYGRIIVIGMNMVLSLLFITASNQSAATALSKEGGEFVLLKTSPAKTHLICWAKLTTNVVISTIFIALSLGVVGLFGVIAPITLLQMFVICFICNIAHILWSMQLDIENPLMHEYAMVGEVSDNKNVGRSILYGFLLAFIIGLISAVVYFIYPDTKAFIVMSILSFVFLLIRAYLFNLNLRCLFSDLEL
jgi:hypothetical protein